MRKLSIILCLIIVILSLLLSASTPTEYNFTIKTIYPASNLYADSSLQGQVLIVLPQNATIVAVGEPFYQNDIRWQQAEYEGYNGFILYNNLYVSLQNDTYTIKIVKALSPKMGQGILLYDSHDFASEHIAVCDGTKLNLIINDIDYGQFSKVEYNGKAYYVESAHITSGLSYNQTLSLIIVSAFAAVVLFIVLALVISKRKKLKKY